MLKTYLATIGALTLTSAGVVTALICASNEALSQSQRSALGALVREQIAPCWNPPAAAGASASAVIVRFELNPDGTLKDGPTVVSPGDAPDFEAYATSALRAVRRCSPLKLPAEAYESWRVVEITFDPRDAQRRAP